MLPLIATFNMDEPAIVNSNSISRSLLVIHSSISCIYIYIYIYIYILTTLEKLCNTGGRVMKITKMRKMGLVLRRLIMQRSLWCGMGQRNGMLIEECRSLILFVPSFYFSQICFVYQLVFLFNYLDCATMWNFILKNFCD